MQNEKTSSIFLRSDSFFLFLGFSIFYVFLAWVVCGGDKWWIIDYIDGTNVFYGDDAYRFFLARSAWINPDLYTYNFVLPAFLLLDGMVVSVAGGDVFLSRCIHALFGALSITIIWQSGRLIGINKVVMFSAVMVMGLLPRFSLTSLSFYGEAWLLFILCFITYLYLTQRYLWVSIFASLLPLIRPEGMFLWVPLWASMLWNKRWKEAAVMLLPGLVYFIYLNVALQSLSDYGYWRIELRRILNKLVLNKTPWAWLDTYSLLLLLPSFLGFLYKPVRVLWPLLLGGGLWFFWLIILIASSLSDYEDRYTYILIPIMVILWASFIAWAWDKMSALKISNKWLTSGVLVCALVVVLNHFYNMYMIKESLRLVGAPLVLKSVLLGEWGRIFMHNPQDDIKAWKNAASKIEDLLGEDENIDKVVIFDHSFYYFLNPYKIPSHVTVGYATNGYRVFHILFDGQIFAQHPGGKMYSYIDFSKPEFVSDERRVLYVDIMPLSGYPYTWKFAGHEMYLFSYKESLSPKKSLDEAPRINLDLMKKAYEKWW